MQTYVSTAITAVAIVGKTVTVTGTGTVNYGAGYFFIAVIVGGDPDTLAFTITKTDATTYYTAGPSEVGGGDVTISP
jgi:hypothetical protein